MENKLIKEIAGEMYPDPPTNDFMANWQLTMLLQETTIKLLTALEPFIPKWVKVETQEPEREGEYFVQVRLNGNEVGRTVGIYRSGKFYDIAYLYNASVELEVLAYQPLPSTTHPYEELLNQLKSKP